MKHLTIAVIALALSCATAFAEKLMPFSEVEACVEISIEIFAGDGDLKERREALEKKRVELESLKEKTEALKAEAKEKESSGDMEAYNRLVKQYNDLAIKYDGKYKDYNELTTSFNTFNDELKTKKEDFVSSCEKKKFFMRDLRKACRESPEPETPFCARNLK